MTEAKKSGADAMKTGAEETAKGPVLILCGSLSANSISEAVARQFETMLIEKGLSTQIETVRSLNLPFFNPDIHRADHSVAARFLADVRRARSMIWVCPAYHRTMSGSFKNVLDFIEVLSREDPPYLKGKSIGMIAVGGGLPATITTITSMEFSAHALRAVAIPYSVPVPFSGQLLDEEGRIKNQGILERLTLLANEVEIFLRSYNETR